MRTLNVVTANKGPLVTKSGFSGYDVCINSYVGCQFGCSYCYVRFFVKDPEVEWGEFVRLRKHITTRLPRDTPLLIGKRLVLGTMTDPYQPLERKHRLTREVLDILLASPHKPDKVGIFTRSPIVLDDLDRIAQLPRPRIHFTVTPFERDVMQRLEPIAIETRARFKAIRAIKAKGIRVHVSVAPALPLLSEKLTGTIAKELADIGVDEFFVDPMQAYAQSFDATFGALSDLPEWPRIQSIIKGGGYARWKRAYRVLWQIAWKPYMHLPILPIWSDHEHHTWVDMRTGEIMSKRLYGDDLTA